MLFAHDPKGGSAGAAIACADRAWPITPFFLSLRNLQAIVVVMINLTETVMPPVNCTEAPSASKYAPPHQGHDPNLNELEEELRRLSAVTQELLGEFTPEAPEDSPASDTRLEFGELEQLRIENAELRRRVEELESHAD